MSAAEPCPYVVQSRVDGILFNRMNADGSPMQCTLNEGHTGSHSHPVMAQYEAYLEWRRLVSEADGSSAASPIEDGAIGPELQRNVGAYAAKLRDAKIENAPGGATGEGS